MEFQKIFGLEPKQLDWYGIINFTLAVFLDCKWHKYKYSIHISEKDEHAVWRSVTPEPGLSVRPSVRLVRSSIRHVR
jgi:hypothetical protein